MKIYELKDYQQAIILACKGHYKIGHDDSNYESIERIVTKIIGCDYKYITNKNITFWLYDTYEELLEIEETCFKRRNSLKTFMLNDYEFFNREIESMSFNERVVKFLMTEIQTVQVYEKDGFRIVLDKENEYI